MAFKIWTCILLKHIPNLKIYDKHDEFQICPLAKQTRLPFPTSTSSSPHAFHLIHMDLWRPYKTHTLNRACYFFNFGR